MHRFGLESARSGSAFDSPAPPVAAAAGRRSATKSRLAVLAAAFFLLASWAFACCVVRSQAPAFDEIPASQTLMADKKRQNDLRGAVDRILKNSEPLAPKRAEFEGWYRAFVFPQMTHLDKLSQLADNRESLLKNDLALARNEEARQLLVRIALEETRKIAAGNYHPGARYNAMLILGELNQTEAVLTPASSARPPRPLPAALQTLLEEWKKPGASDAMTVACLVGLRRHVDIDRYLPADQKMNADAKKQIYDGALALLKSTAPETRKPMAHAYLQAIAADILAYTGEPGPNGETVAALDAVIGDPAAPDFLKAAAIAAVGEMNLPQAYADQAPALLRSFAEASLGFVLHEVEALNAEKQYRIEFATKPIQGQPGGGYDPMAMISSSYGLSGSEYGSAYPGGATLGPDGLPIDPDKPPAGPLAKERDYILENSRRRLKAYMVETQRALRGRNPQQPAGLARLATKPEEQEIVKAFDDELDEIIDSTEDPELTIVQLIETFSARAAAMQTALGVTPPTTDPATGGLPVSTPAEEATSDANGANGPGGAGPGGPSRGPGARGPGGRGPGSGPAPARGPGARGPAPGGPAAPAAPADGEAEAPAIEETAPAEAPAAEPAPAP